MYQYCFSTLPEELKAGTAALLPMLAMEDHPQGIPIYAQAGAREPGFDRTAEKVTVYYTEKVQFFRMLSFLNSRLVGDSYREQPRHTNLCYMCDQSRNAVLNLPSAQRMIRSLALLGFSELQLYTEETYELDGYPYFGHLRGRWTKQELKDLVAYGEQFGITLVPCIQTLAHLERMFVWPAFKPIQDRGSVMLVGQEETYQLIEQMFKTCAEVFKARKINIGMDEAHDLGMGKYMRANGYVPRPEIMKQHLAKVVELAKKYGFEPMMWNDMYFRMIFGGYYVDEGEFPQEILDSVPPEVTLVYWDYYTKNQERLNHMAKLSKSFKNKVAFAGGCQKWGDFAAANKLTFDLESLHIDACLKQGITDIWTTGWGDDGAEAAHFSILPGLTLYAEKCYKADMTKEWLDTRFEEVFAIPMRAFELMSDVNYPDAPVEQMRDHRHTGKVLLYADLLYGMFDCHIDRDNFPVFYSKLADELATYADHPQHGYMIAVIQKLAEVCAQKSMLHHDILDAYRAEDKEMLEQIACEDIPALIETVDEMLQALTRQWKLESRHFGLEVQQIRLGGLKERLKGSADILMDYVAGRTARIEELEAPRLPADCRQRDGEPLYTNHTAWRSIASVNIL